MTADLIELRCKHCGAPLESEDIGSDAPYVKCQYCGTTQQRVDAKRRTDKARLQNLPDHLGYHKKGDQPNAAAAISHHQ